MKFTVNDKTYFVKWEYDRFYDDKYKYEEYTACKIYDNTTSFDSPIVIGKSTKAEGDNFCKNTGRKISLNRALKKLFPYQTQFGGTPKKDGSGNYDWNKTSNRVQQKEARRIAWQEYFKESPKRLK